MGRRIPIRARVAAAVAIPLVALAAAATVGVVTTTSQVRTASRQAELVAASIGHTDLVSAVQNERNAALAETLGIADDIDLEVDDLDDARRLTDRVRRSQDGSTDLSALDNLPAARQRVDDALDAPATDPRAAHEAFADYTAISSALAASHEQGARDVDDPELRRGDELIHQASRSADAAARLVDRLVDLGSGPGRISQPEEAAGVAKLARDVEASNAELRAKGTGDYGAAADRLLADPGMTGLVAVADEAVAEGDRVDVAELLAATPLGAPGPYPTFRDEVAQTVERRADDLRSQAETRRRWFAGGALAALLAGGAAAWGLSRSITAPLRALRREARAMVDHRLPAAVAEVLDAPGGKPTEPDLPPIAVPSRDEASDVADALTDLQRWTLRLATEQAALRRTTAESFVNVGRRNQNLLSRLLGVVGELESGESDPERIARIHRLDHLATRIRRNAESLLVLSDADVAPRWHPPVAIRDVVRAALGEIENYQRVAVRALDPAMIVNGAAPDLTHLLAELIENGVRHSPPDEPVEIRGRVTAPGYSLLVVDHGLGMSPEEIERANQRLAGTAPPTVAVSKQLGHFVTAALAARHGIKVRVQGSEVVGIAAVVDLPGRTVTPAPAETAPALPPPSPPPPPPPPPAPPSPLATCPPERELPIPIGGAVPAVTANGLVRRVRGAQHPAAIGPAPAWRSPAIRFGDQVLDAGHKVDAAEMQRFLTSLAAGIQRSLTETDGRADR